MLWLTFVCNGVYAENSTINTKDRIRNYEFKLEHDNKLIRNEKIKININELIKSEINQENTSKPINNINRSIVTSRGEVNRTNTQK